MANLSYLHDKRFGVLFARDDETGKTQYAVLTGIAKWRDGRLLVYRGEAGSELEIPQDTFDRIRPVTSSEQPMFEDAEYFTLLTVGPLTAGDNRDSLTDTGVKWPEREKGT
jgi:hypothetical protein